MAPGSRKDLGFFSIPTCLPSHRQAVEAQAQSPIILCESPIDAISCFALHPDHRCISTSGARPNPQWLAALVAQGTQIYCGFDTDPTGETAANAMLWLYPTIKRLRPNYHDWNDVLISQS
jgi:DNA primase